MTKSSVDRRRCREFDAVFAKPVGPDRIAAAFRNLSAGGGWFVLAPVELRPLSPSYREIAQVAMRAIVADDHPLYREAVRLRLERSFPAADIARSVERGRVGARLGDGSPGPARPHPARLEHAG
jgi:hypothetical protein